MSNESAAVLDPYAADHDALRALKAMWERAVRENDLDLMRPHLAEGYSIVTYTNREFRDFEAFKTRWQETRARLLKGGSYTVELLPEPSRFQDDLALCQGDSHNKLTTGAGEHFEFSSRWTVICRKVGGVSGGGGQWKIVRAHSSINPFDNPMMRAGFKKKAGRLAIGMLVVGAVLGACVGYLVHK